MNINSSGSLYDFAFLLLVYFFLQFNRHVNSSKIYVVGFFFLVLDISFLLNYETFLKANREDTLLYMPYIVLIALYTAAVFENNGWENLLDYVYETITGHIYNPMNLRSLVFLWPFFLKFLYRNRHTKIKMNELLLALTILTLSIFKELFKKYYILILIVIYNYNSPFIFWLWFNHLFLILILISLLPIDPKAVLFINQFFGPYCIAWLGSYQTLKLGTVKITFVLPSEYLYKKENPQLTLDLQNLEKTTKIIHRLLKRLYIQEKKK